MLRRFHLLFHVEMFCLLLESGAGMRLKVYSYWIIHLRIFLYYGCLTSCVVFWIKILL